MKQSINADEVKKRLGFGNSKKIQQYFTNQCAKHMNKYVPFDIGMLRRLIDIGYDYVEYQSPYARYLYYGKLMLALNGSSWAKYGEKKYVTSKDLKYHTPSTGAHWDKLMWSAEKEKIISDTERYLKNG